MEQFSGTILNAEGQPVAGALCTVTDFDSGAVAQLYENDEVTLKSNPFASGSEGQVEFNAINGKYVCTCTKQGFTRTWSKILLNDTAQTSGIESLKKTFTQASHGFVIGNVLRFNGTAWVKARADAANTSEAQGIVSSVPSANAFELTMMGAISGLSGLVADTVYFLSDITDGLLTATEPTAFGHISKAMLYARSATSGNVYQMRGEIITDGAFDASAIGYTPGNLNAWSSTPSTLQGALDELARYQHAIGEPIPWFSTSLPDGNFAWIAGQVLGRVAYSTLFAVYGTTFNTGGEASDSFRMPDPLGAALFALDKIPGGSLAGRNPNGTVLGNRGGSYQHTLLTTEMPAHTHTETTVSGAGSNLDTPGSWGPTASVTGSTGGGLPHNNMPPWLGCYYITRY